MSLFSYLVAKCYKPSGGGVGECDCWCCCWWWWWRRSLPKHGPEYQTATRQRSAKSPWWEHDPITGLCNWSEPCSALYNSIRSAWCSQLGRELPMSRWHITMWVTSPLYRQLLLKGCLRRGLWCSRSHKPASHGTWMRRLNIPKDIAWPTH